MDGPSQPENVRELHSVISRIPEKFQTLHARISRPRQLRTARVRMWKRFPRLPRAESDRKVAGFWLTAKTRL